ncbi:MAG: PilZ domain-containing protein [Candidatus Electrothrix sp. AUS4]|nr:PilZ domain-containing protein [Candidatus Electrothrix sp. AUS4]
MNRRQFTRIKSPFPILLNFGRNQYESFAINFSLGGLYVQGWFDQDLGDSCEIKLSLSEKSGLAIEAVCSVVRQDKNGLALRFTSMEPDTFLFLQEALLYKNNAHWCRQPDWCTPPPRPPAYSWKML